MKRYFVDELKLVYQERIASAARAEATAVSASAHSKYSSSKIGSMVKCGGAKHWSILWGLVFMYGCRYVLCSQSL